MIGTRNQRLLVVGVALPVVIAATASIVMISWLPELPSEVATQWNADGVSQTSSVWLSILLPLGIVALYSAFITGSVVAGHSSSLVGARILIVSAPFLACLLAIGVTGSVYGQRGITDPLTAPDPGPWLLTGAAVGLVVAALCWLVVARTDVEGR
ncbi:hypothetical protein [Salinibacterium sp. ZJ450]|uniref:hypothetical protein n=1 Tax=Salinibacterium sp. ZJ450 TaxID=2708338 RepID=UPI00142243A3|nr:hypothetical protein [Salinibacterium sp. ZJ450]